MKTIMTLKGTPLVVKTTTISYIKFIFCAFSRQLPTSHLHERRGNL
jgi:hypothetical protein